MHTYQIISKGVTLEKSEKALILLHGRGGTAENILTLADYFIDDEWYVAAPQATNHTWYPYSFMAPQSENEPWLTSALDILQKLNQEILKFIPNEKIFIAGFSQGACLTAEFAARNAEKYGGLVIFTGGLIGKQLELNNYQGDFSGTGIYMSNGDNDPHVPLSRSEETRKQLEKMGAKVTLDIFPNRPHTILEEELKKAKNILH